MDKIINQTEHGKVFKCSKCNKIHVEFNNLNFNFTDEEYEHFATYFTNIDGAYWEQLNKKSIYRRKILVPLDHININMLLNNQELEELKKLLIKHHNKQQQLKLLSYKMIDFNILHN